MFSAVPESGVLTLAVTNCPWFLWPVLPTFSWLLFLPGQRQHLCAQQVSMQWLLSMPQALPRVSRAVGRRSAQESYSGSGFAASLHTVFFPEQLSNALTGWQWLVAPWNWSHREVICMTCAGRINPGTFTLHAGQMWVRSSLKSLFPLQHCHTPLPTPDLLVWTEAAPAWVQKVIWSLLRCP